jgi:hypothetical protein
MRKPTIKVTYSLDSLTVMEIETMAREWGVPKSEVVRRSVHEAVANKDSMAGRGMTQEEALARLQREPRLGKKRAEKWMQEVAAERKASYRP